MPNIITKFVDHILWVTFNRVEKHNAFDDEFIADFQAILDDAYHNPSLRLIVLNHHGAHFSAGADLAWMQRMSSATYAENVADANKLANLFHTLYKSPVPTVAVIRGNAMGGGAGLVAVCDIAIAAETAFFCFSEVKLGLIPAVISPYVMQSLGTRQATQLLLSAERINAQRALEITLIHHCVAPEVIEQFAHDYVTRMAALAPMAVRETKALLRSIQGLPIDSQVQTETAKAIATKRLSAEGQLGLKAFLTKTTPNWDDACLIKS